MARIRQPHDTGAYTVAVQAHAFQTVAWVGSGKAGHGRAVGSRTAVEAPCIDSEGVGIFVFVDATSCADGETATYGVGGCAAAGVGVGHGVERDVWRGGVRCQWHQRGRHSHRRRR